MLLKNNEVKKLYLWTWNPHNSNYYNLTINMIRITAFGMMFFHQVIQIAYWHNSKYLIRTTHCHNLNYKYKKKNLYLRHFLHMIPWFTQKKKSHFLHEHALILNFGEYTKS